MELKLEPPSELSRVYKSRRNPTEFSRRFNQLGGEKVEAFTTSNPSTFHHPIHSIMSKMQNITPESLNVLQSRVAYLRDFIEFTDVDAAALHAAKPVVAPLLPTVVDMVYEKLLGFDITASSFIPRQSGYTGEAPARLQDLSQEHPQIKFRKDFLRGYLQKLVTMDYTQDASWAYLDNVGLMHTGEPAFTHRAKKPALRVELIHCAILLGYVEDILVNAVITHPDLSIDTKNAVARAVNKVVWIQNDLFTRHYLKEAAPTSSLVIARPKAATLAFGLILVGFYLAKFLK